MVDHITSPSALLLPLNKILDVLEKHKVMSLVDGAHAPGQIKLNLSNIKADFYTGKLKQMGVVVI